MGINWLVFNINIVAGMRPIPTSLSLYAVSSPFVMTTDLFPLSIHLYPSYFTAVPLLKVC